MSKNICVGRIVRRIDIVSCTKRDQHLIINDNHLVGYTAVSVIASATTETTTTSTAKSIDFLLIDFLSAIMRFLLINFQIIGVGFSGNLQLVFLHFFLQPH